MNRTFVSFLFKINERFISNHCILIGKKLYNDILNFKGYNQRHFFCLPTAWWDSSWYNVPFCTCRTCFYVQISIPKLLLLLHWESRTIHQYSYFRRKTFGSSSALPFSWWFGLCNLNNEKIIMTYLINTSFRSIIICKLTCKLEVRETNVLLYCDGGPYVAKWPNMVLPQCPKP